MKWIQILRKGKYALLQSESDSQYVVASGYNPDDPEGQQWGHGSYFPYWGDADKKIEMLQNALDYFRCLTENDFIPRSRLIELATRFKDVETGDEDVYDLLADMTDEEKYFFGLDGIDDELDL